MSSQAVIDHPKGILMERRKLTEDQAFTELSRASRNLNIKLRDVADELVRTGALPERPPTVRRRQEVSASMAHPRLPGERTVSETFTHRGAAGLSAFH